MRMTLPFFTLFMTVIRLVDLFLFSSQASVREFAEAIRAYRVIFPDSEKQLIKLARDLITT